MPLYNGCKLHRKKENNEFNRVDIRTTIAKSISFTTKTLYAFFTFDNVMFVPNSRG